MFGRCTGPCRARDAGRVGSRLSPSNNSNDQSLCSMPKKQTHPPTALQRLLEHCVALAQLNHAQYVLIAHDGDVQPPPPKLYMARVGYFFNMCKCLTAIMPRPSLCIAILVCDAMFLSVNTKPTPACSKRHPARRRRSPYEQLQSGRTGRQHTAPIERIASSVWRGYMCVRCMTTIRVCQPN